MALKFIKEFFTATQYELLINAACDASSVTL